MGKRSEVIFGNRMSGQVVKKAENSKERFVRRFGDDSEVDYPLAVVKNPYIGDTLGVSAWANTWAIPCPIVPVPTMHIFIIDKFKLQRF